MRLLARFETFRAEMDAHRVTRFGVGQRRLSSQIPIYVYETTKARQRQLTALLFIETGCATCLSGGGGNSVGNISGAVIAAKQRCLATEQLGGIDKNQHFSVKINILRQSSVFDLHADSPCIVNSVKKNFQTILLDVLVDGPSCSLPMPVVIDNQYATNAQTRI